MTTVYTGGTFDMLHPGHIDLLEACRDIAGKNGRVVVALNRDEFIMQFKGRAPICTYDERKHMLMGCKYVDEVVANKGDADSKPAIKLIDPDFVVIGDDWATKDYYGQMGFTREWLYENAIRLVYVARLRNLSSTEIKARVNGG